LGVGDACPGSRSSNHSQNLNLKMANRHLSRSIVLQTLFEWDFLPIEEKNNKGDAFVKEALKRNLSEFAPGFEEDPFAVALLELTLKKRATVDEVIEKAAPDWPIEKISVVDRNILRIGLTELLFGDSKEVPPKVAINEAIELAKSFGGENSSKFVNGVLGAVYKEIGEPGKEQTSRKKKEEPVDITKLPVEKKGGALIYARKDNRQDGEIMFALVHDVFGYWTISKGGIEEGENEKQATVREIKEEIGLDINIQEKLGENEYVATHPEKGKSLKKVAYFLAESEYRELVLGNSNGLDGARWFNIESIPELRIYNDIIPLIAKAIDILTAQDKNK
jgi:transcription antitermination protein NusB